MSTKGKRLYTCDECKKGTYFSMREENKVARLRCPYCGSARMMISAMGKDRLADAFDAIREVKGTIDKNGTSSVVPGSGGP